MTFNLKVMAKYEDNPTISAEKQFSVTFVNLCAAPTITFPA